MVFIALLFLGFLSSVNNAVKTSFHHPEVIQSVPMTSDVKSHRVCDSFCLEVLELIPKRPFKPKGVALLVPGFFHNYRVFHLSDGHLSEKASYARLLEERLNLKVYFFHPRGIGKSDLPSDLTMDDIAAEDLPLAIDFIFKRERQKIIPIGHSQGSITLQAYLSGLVKDQARFKFHSETATQRQRQIKGVGLLAGNVAMKGFSGILGPIALIFKPLIQNWGWIPAKALTQKLSPLKQDARVHSFGPFAYVSGNPLSGKWSLAYSNIWNFLFSRKQIEPYLWEKNYDLSLQNTSSGILLQFAEAVSRDGLQTTAGQKYSDFLGNIQIPVFQITFGIDQMAIPQATYEEDFSKIGGPDFQTKKFKIFPDQGHEDFFMNPKLMVDHLEYVKWLRD